MARTDHSNASLGEVLELARRLSLIGKVQLIAQIASDIEHDLTTKRPVVGVSLLGLTKDLGRAPSEEEIDADRAAAWANVSRETD